MEAASPEANRYRYPALPPGERALRVEQEMLGMERRLAERVMQALDGANLTHSERETVVATVLAFMSDRAVAERQGAPKPGAAALLVALDVMLERFSTGPGERERVTGDIARLIADASVLSRAA